jgi:hypothetical protein
MSISDNRDEINTLLTDAFAPPPSADFEEWRRRHPESLACLDPQRMALLVNRRRFVTQAVIFAVSAAILACVWLGISDLGSHGRGSAAFAEVLQQIAKAKTITWKTTYYLRHVSKDKQKTWLTTETKTCAYKSPGLYREVTMDDKNQVSEVSIKDHVKKKELLVFPQEKKAILNDLSPGDYNPFGPFDWIKEELQEPALQWVEKRKTPAGEVNIFRHAFRSKVNGIDRSYDFWIDQATKRLVELHIPGSDFFDPETDPARNTLPGESWNMTVLGDKQHEIVWDAALDDSLFRLEPPEGYTLEVQRREEIEITEREMIDFLGVAAEFNDKTFPDEDFIPGNRINKARSKPEQDRTPAEQKTVKRLDFYIVRFGILPMAMFRTDHTVEGSYRYLGKGVKLGDKDGIVCWYKLKAASDPNTYRVVYGDLSVKDVKSDDLPLPVESRE